MKTINFTGKWFIVGQSRKSAFALTNEFNDLLTWDTKKEAITYAKNDICLKMLKVNAYKIKTPV